MHHILIVEDGADSQIIIKQALQDNSCRCQVVSTVSEAIKILGTEHFDLIILDISLPDGDGFQLCSHLQSHESLRDIPVFFLTANEDVSAKVAAFALGADDYVNKPFNPMELRARVGSKLRKRENREISEQNLIKGQLRVHFLSQKAYKTIDGKEEELNLTPLEFKILAFLARSEDRVLSREQILNSVWGSNVHVFDRTVDTHISSLRKKIQPYGHLIQAVLGSGYCFSLAPVAKKKTGT